MIFDILKQKLRKLIPAIYLFKHKKYCFDDFTLVPDPETEFFKGLMRLGFGLPEQKKLKELSQQVEWAKGWPDNNISFWNAEAFMWGYKIPKEKRKLIFRELSFLQGNGKTNLDLGCGAHSYIPSVGLDISPKMLQFNDNCSKKIVGDLEKKMPFEDEVFDSVTAIFLFNYIVNYQQLLQEIYRILKKNGVLVAVLSCKEINEWQRQKQVNSFTAKEWKQNIKNARFIVTHSQVDQLLFLKGRKNSF